MAGIIKRLKRAVNAELHDMMDEQETPDRIAKQLVLETTQKFETAQKLTIEAVTSEKQLALQLEGLESDLSKSQEAAEIALKNGDEVGARRALESKVHSQKLVDTLGPQLEKSKANSAALKEQLAGLQKKLESLKNEKIAIEARYNGATATGKMEEMSADILAIDDTDARLDKANSLVSAIEARNEAVADVASVTNPQASVTNADQDVELEMQKLRDQLKK